MERLILLISLRTKNQYYQANASGSRIHTNKSRTSEYVEVNDALYKWLSLACFKNVYPRRPELMEKANRKAWETRLQRLSWMVRKMEEEVQCEAAQNLLGI